MSGELTIRHATAADVDAILALWRLGGVEHDPEHDRDEIVTKLDYDGDLFLVAEVGEPGNGTLVASVMGTYDGHRGRVKRAVVDPNHQGSGAARQIMHELEARFLGRGITELRLEVWAENTNAQGFWTHMGWEHLEAIRYYVKSL